MIAVRRLTTRGVAAIALVGLVFGCLGRSPQIRFYTMSSVSGTSVAAVADDLSIGVGPARLPRYLDRPQLVTRADCSQPEWILVPQGDVDCAGFIVNEVLEHCVEFNSSKP